MHQTRQLFDGRRLANDCERIFSRPGYQQKYLPFPSLARNKRHAQRVPSDVGNGQSKFGGDTMRRSRDIRARAEASAIGRKSRRRGRNQEDDHNLTFEPNEFGVREPNSAEIRLAVFEKRANRRTHRHSTSPLYIDKLQCPASPGGQHMPGASSFNFIAPQLTHTFVIEPIQHGSGGETNRLYFSRPEYQQKYLPFPSPARNKRHAQRVPSDVGNGQSKFGGDTMRRSGDNRARAEASAIGRKSRRRGRSQEDDYNLTFDRNEFGVRKPNSAEIGLAVVEKLSNRRTDRQTPLLYIYRCALGRNGSCS